MKGFLDRRNIKGTGQSGTKGELERKIEREEKSGGLNALFCEEMNNIKRK